MLFGRKLRRSRFSIAHSLLWALAGAAVFSGVLYGVFWGIMPHPQSRPLLWSLGFAYIAVWSVLAKLRSYPYAATFETLLAAVCLASALLLACLAGTRQFYSGTIIAVFSSYCVLWFGAEFAFLNRHAQYRLAAIPGEWEMRPGEFPGHEILPLERPVLPEEVDGLVVDFRRELPDEWMAFVSNCQNRGIPVVPLLSLVEGCWGRVPLELVKTAGELTPSGAWLYMCLKPWLERLAVLLSLPLALPVMAAVAVLVKIDSPGPALFAQWRVGQNGRRFRMYKFRSMFMTSDADGLPAAPTAADSRITRVGRVIRKFRLDELPQFFNILKGDMVLIGPRAEMVKSAEEFEKAIPYYTLRYLPYPGLTGWAQVRQGNISGMEDTREKLTYDLYYLKHLSLGLDLHIAIKTVRVVVTGFEY